MKGKKSETESKFLEGIWNVDEEERRKEGEKGADGHRGMKREG